MSYCDYDLSEGTQCVMPPTPTPGTPPPPITDAREYDVLIWVRGVYKILQMFLYHNCTSTLIRHNWIHNVGSGHNVRC